MPCMRRGRIRRRGDDQRAVCAFRGAGCPGHAVGYEEGEGGEQVGKQGGGARVLDVGVGGKMGVEERVERLPGKRGAAWREEGLGGEVEEPGGAAVEEAGEGLDEDVAHGGSARVAGCLPEGPERVAGHLGLDAEVDELAGVVAVGGKCRVGICAMGKFEKEQVQLCVLGSSV